MAIISQAARVRCYKCGESEVEHVCHHCGKAICERHNVHIPFSRRLSNEFMGLGLRTLPAGEAGAHCAPCAKRYHKSSYQWMLALAILLLVGGFILDYFADPEQRPNFVRWSEQATQIGTYVFVGYLLLMGLNMLWDWWMNRLLRPVIATIQNVAIAEKIEGRITLDEEGDYKAEGTVGPQGKMTMKLHVTPAERDRARRFRWRSDQFCAGFAVLEGAIKAKFDDADDFIEECIKTVALKGRVEGPFWAGRVEQPWPWHKEYAYTVPTPKDKTPAPPVEMIPSLRQEGEKPTALELVLQLPGKWRGLSGSTASAAVESLEIFGLEGAVGVSPAGTLAQVEGEEGVDEKATDIDSVEDEREKNAAGDTNEENNQESNEEEPSIKWTGVSFVKDGKFVPSKSFYIFFSEKLSTLPTLKGKLKLRFAGTLSGIENMAFFYPTGVKRKGKGVRKSTIVEVEFELDLTTLEAQENIIRHEETERYEGIGSNYKVINHLTNALSGQLNAEDGLGDDKDGFNFENIYVKRVVENSPRVEKHDANLTNRYWDIGGRWYDELYPVDFHIVVKGIESIEKSIRDAIQLEIAVQGMVKTTPQSDGGVAEEMRERIQQLHHHLQQRVSGEIGKLKEQHNYNQSSRYTLQSERSNRNVQL